VEAEPAESAVVAEPAESAVVAEPAESAVVAEPAEVAEVAEVADPVVEVAGEIYPFPIPVLPSDSLASEAFPFQAQEIFVPQYGDGGGDGGEKLLPSFLFLLFSPPSLLFFLLFSLHALLFFLLFRKTLDNNKKNFLRFSS